MDYWTSEAAEARVCVLKKRKSNTKSSVYCDSFAASEAKVEGRNDYKVMQQKSTNNYKSWQIILGPSNCAYMIIKYIFKVPNAAFGHLGICMFYERKDQNKDGRSTDFCATQADATYPAFCIFQWQRTNLLRSWETWLVNFAKRQSGLGQWRKAFSSGTRVSQSPLQPQESIPLLYRWPPCSLAPLWKQTEQIAFIMQISYPSSCLPNGGLHTLAAWLWQKPWQLKKGPQTQKPPDSVVFFFFF